MRASRWQHPRRLVVSIDVEQRGPGATPQHTALTSFARPARSPSSGNSSRVCRALPPRGHCGLTARRTAPTRPIRASCWEHPAPSESSPFPRGHFAPVRGSSPPSGALPLLGRIARGSTEPRPPFPVVAKSSSILVNVDGRRGRSSDPSHSHWFPFGGGHRARILQAAPVECRRRHCRPSRPLDARARLLWPLRQPSKGSRRQRFCCRRRSPCTSGARTPSPSDAGANGAASSHRRHHLRLSLGRKLPTAPTPSSGRAAPPNIDARPSRPPRGARAASFLDASARRRRHRHLDVRATSAPLLVTAHSPPIHSEPAPSIGTLGLINSFSDKQRPARRCLPSSLRSSSAASSSSWDDLVLFS